MMPMSLNLLFYTLRQSVIVRAMHPMPATSTTFSCQLSKTLIAACVGSVAPGREPTWLNPPVDCGVTFDGVLDACGDPVPIPL
jgi:hypothetical protein